MSYPNFDDVEYSYQRAGYSLKQLFGLMFSGSIGLAAAIGVIIIVIKFLNAIPSDMLELAATMFIFGLVGLILAAGAIGMVIAYTYVRKPGIQTSGRLAQLEKKLGLD